MKIRKWDKHVVLAICDADVLGKTLKQGKMVFNICEEFYKGTLVSLDEAMDMVQQSTIVNMVGRRIVESAVKRRLVHPEAILRIDGVPHAQIVKV